MKPIRILLAGLLLWAPLACGKPKPTDVVARVAGEPIVVDDVLQALYRDRDKYGDDAFQKKDRFLKIKERLLEDLIQKKILTKEAIKQGIVVNDDDLEKEIHKYKSRYTERDFQKILEARKIDYQTWREVKRANLMADKLIEQKLFADLKISEEKMREYYDQHREEFTQPEAVKIRQIVTENQGSAEAVLKKLKEGENFARMAHDLSIAPDRMQGGDLGFISRGSFPKEFEVCFDMKVGELSPVVSSLYGFHIFKVIEKRPAKQLPFEEVKGQIEEWLKEKAREEAFQAYYEKLRKEYPVEIHGRVLKRIAV
ncbi:MAG: peptidyl-prolyl cis-trans isomerase [bacterium]